MRYNRIAALGVVSISIIACVSNAFADSVLDPRWLPSNMLRAAERCDLRLLSSGEIFKAAVLNGTPTTGVNYPAIHRIDLGSGNFVDACIVQYKYTSRMNQNSSKQSWDIAGEDIKSLVSSLESKSKSRFGGKIYDGDAVFYELDQPNLTAFISIKEGRSARQLEVSIGYSTMPFSLGYYNRELKCEIPNYIKVTFKRIMSHPTHGIVTPGSWAEEFCKRDQRSCKEQMFAIVERARGYAEAISKYDPEQRIKRTDLSGFMKPTGDRLSGIPGFYTFHETWFRHNWLYTVDLKTNKMELYSDGKKLDLSGSCSPSN